MAKLLGAPRDTLLKAMEICPVTRCSAILSIEPPCRWVYGDGSTHSLMKYDAIGVLEHAFRVWLEARDWVVWSSCFVTRVVQDGNSESVVKGSHYLATLAEAVCKIGEGFRDDHR